MRASDAQLVAQGATACPAGSRLGSGRLDTDTGSAVLIPRYVENKVTTFNAEGEVIVLAESSEPPTRAVSRAKIEGASITTQVPPLPGNPPPDPYTAFKRLRIASEAAIRAGRAYARTPPGCPSAGYWTNTVILIYRDGRREDLKSRSPCRRATQGARCGGRRATVIGTGRRDVLRGTRLPDVIVGFSGDDRIRGGGGDDLICAGRGDDHVTAGRGDDRVWGGRGDDRLVGRAGADRLHGGPGRDRRRQ